MTDGRRHARLFAGMVVSLAALIAPVQASAATLKGSTASGSAVKLEVDATGKPTGFRAKKYTVECKNGSVGVDQSSFRRFDQAQPGSFTDRSKRKSKDGKFKLKTKTTISGALSATGWAGSFKESTRVVKRKSGKTIDRCSLKTTWTATA